MISPHISPKEQSVWERLRRLDFHPKTKEDFRVRTAYGGASEYTHTECCLLIRVRGWGKEWTDGSIGWMMD